jgi:hypothetical protein
MFCRLSDHPASQHFDQLFSIIRASPQAAVPGTGSSGRGQGRFLKGFKIIKIGSD